MFYNYLGIAFEVVFLFLGIYLYVFSRGGIKSKEATQNEKMELFRSSNEWWMRLGGLALIAIMGLNLVLRVI